MTSYWLSTHKMTVCVDVSGSKIVAAAPIISKFIGQPIENLTSWLKRQGGYREAIL